MLTAIQTMATSQIVCQASRLGGNDGRRAAAADGVAHSVGVVADLDSDAVPGFVKIGGGLVLSHGAPFRRLGQPAGPTDCFGNNSGDLSSHGGPGAGFW